MKKQLLFILLLFCGCLVAGEQANGFPVSRIVQKNGVSCIEVNGEIINPVHFWTVARRDKSERNAAEIAGLRLIAVSLPDAIADDHDAVADLLAYHLERNPDARLILYVNFDGAWVEAHPEAWCRTEDGGDTIGGYDGRQGHRPSLDSELWQNAFAERLINLITYLKSSSYANRIIGFHLIGGISSEWLHWGSQNDQLGDYSACGQEDFRRFLRAKYGTDAALQAAWAQPKVTLAPAADAPVLLQLLRQASPTFP